ncbi:hypothetical protein EDB85DRAFT_2156377 [Lactarius pseudohatsudake]|nr:hypothetical protein EDB85DRAFT_2156377 [Lactarius pseudohatsudake]
MPAADRPLPSPHRPASGAHEGTPPARSPPPSLLSAPPPFPWKGACEGNAPSRGTPFAREGAHKAKPSPPPRRAAGLPRRKGKPAPVAPPSLRPPPPPSFAQTGSRRDHAPAPPCPRTQEGGQRAHHVPWRGQRQPSPPPPTHARGGTAHPPSPLRTGNAIPATRTPHRTARARKGRHQASNPFVQAIPAHVYAPRHTHCKDPSGSGPEIACFWYFRSRSGVAWLTYHFHLAFSWRRTSLSFTINRIPSSLHPLHTHTLSLSLSPALRYFPHSLSSSPMNRRRPYSPCKRLPSRPYAGHASSRLVLSLSLKHPVSVAPPISL